ncbi:MAG TPA: NADH-quinone oxidoreductase subunit C [Acidimicrobiales bacterium]|nr:NADH-quinone oxidoreductase subunit C [Acidimicrobiales bacterium]
MSPDNPTPADTPAAGEEPEAVPAAEEAAADPAPEPEPEPAAAPEPVDPAFQSVVDSLTERLGEGFLASEVVGGDLCVRVDATQWRRAAEVAKTELGMDYFCFLSGIDWLPNPLLAGRDVWDPNPNEASEVAVDEPAGTIHTGIAGGDTRFQVFARLYSTRTHVGFTLKADLDDESPVVPSITSVYRGADWHERETWEMYGFDFQGHPGLRHLYLPGEFEGHPLRKDFPMLAREVKPWPGLVDKEQIPGEASDEESAPAEEEAAT